MNLFLNHKLTAGPGNVLPFGNPQGDQDSPVEEVLLKCFDPGPVRSLVVASGGFIKRNQVDLALHPVKQTDQPSCILQ